MHWLPHRLCLMCTPTHNLHGYTQTAPREIEPHPGKKCPGPCCKTMTFGTSARVRSGTSPARAQNIAAALHPCFATECTACWVWWVVRRRFQHHFALAAFFVHRTPHAMPQTRPVHAAPSTWQACRCGSTRPHLPCLHTRRAPHSHARTHLHTRRVTRNLLAFSYPRMN